MSDNPYRPKLVFTGEPFAGRICELAQDKITVGRGGHNTLSSLACAHPLNTVVANESRRTVPTAG